MATALRLEEAFSVDRADDTFRCGHERTDANTKLVRNGTGTACLICFRQKDRDYRRNRRRAEKSA